MKDLVENRGRLTLAQKMTLMRLAIKENGLAWSACLGAYYAGSAVAEKAFGVMDALRKKKGLPGLNSAAMNKVIWEAWDWSAAGEEWTPSPEWKASLIRKVLEPNVPEGSRVLEVGPGGGRWTEELLKRASKLTGVDISETCVERCRERFGEDDKAEFFVVSGSDLNGVDEASIDVIWSFDVFVHINEPEVKAYAAEFARVLKPGGKGILHHGSLGGGRGGWRSNLTTEAMNRILDEAGLAKEEQFQTWKDGEEEHEAGLYEDVITVFSSRRE